MSMFAEDDGGVIVYMCKTDWDCEIGGALGGNHVYASVGDLKRSRSCVAQCGIVEVRVYLSRVIQEEDYSECINGLSDEVSDANPS